jgi:hypothetical protein
VFALVLEGPLGDHQERLLTLQLGVEHRPALDSGANGWLFA